MCLKPAVAAVPPKHPHRPNPLPPPSPCHPHSSLHRRRHRLFISPTSPVFRQNLATLHPEAMLLTGSNCDDNICERISDKSSKWLAESVARISSMVSLRNACRARSSSGAKKAMSFWPQQLQSPNGVIILQHVLVVVQQLREGEEQKTQPRQEIYWERIDEKPLCRSQQPKTWLLLLNGSPKVLRF